jgi:tRNA-specific 2-thiouridylase
LADIPKFPLRAKAKIRYRQEEQECEILEEKGKYLVKFNKKQRAITS